MSMSRWRRVQQERTLIPPGLGLALAVISVSFAAPLFRLAEAPPLQATFWRLAFAVLLLLPFTWHSLGVWHAYTPLQWRLTILAGMALGAHFCLWVTSLFYTTVAASVSLVTLQAVFVAIGGALLGEKMSRRAWVGVTIAVAGAVIIAAGAGGFGGTGRRALFGDLLAILGGVGSAVYLLVGRKLRQTQGLVSYVTPVYAVAALTAAVAVALAGGNLMTGTQSSTFGYFVLLAAVPMLGGHTLANWCLKHMPAHTVATWILLEPAGAALLAWPLLHEIPALTTVLGGALVLWGASRTMSRRELPGAPQ